MDRPVAVITGSSSGVGAACARELARRGWNVVVNYNSKRDAAELVAQECRDLGAEVRIKGANVGSDADCRALVAEAEQAWGRLDALVNNAGVTKFNDHANLDGLSDEDFLSLYRTNVVGPYQMVRAAEALLRASASPSVVNVASIAGVMGIGSSVAYAASKGALVTMTLSLARALGPIRVNAVCPGFIEGDWLRQGLGSEIYDATIKHLQKSSPLGRVSTPESVAQSIIYFIEGAPEVTGETLMMDGGMHLGGSVLSQR